MLERYINNLSGTDVHRTTGRTLHLFLLRNFSQAKMISSCIDILRLTRMRYFLPHNVIQGQTPIGKSPLLTGQPFFIALNRANRLEKLPVITASRMRRFDVCCGPLVAGKRGV